MFPKYMWMTDPAMRQIILFQLLEPSSLTSRNRWHSLRSTIHLGFETAVQILPISYGFYNLKMILTTVLSITQDTFDFIYIKTIWFFFVIILSMQTFPFSGFRSSTTCFGTFRIVAPFTPMRKTQLRPSTTFLALFSNWKYPKIYHTKLSIKISTKKITRHKMDIYSLVHCPCIVATHCSDGDGSCDQCCMWRNIDSNRTSLTTLYSISPWRGHVSHQVDCQFDFIWFKLGLNKVALGFT